jgi:hypothetical protein
MVPKVFAAGLIVLLSQSSLSARQSGIRGVQLPPDPVIPIPLYPAWMIQRDQDAARIKALLNCISAQGGAVSMAGTLLSAADAFFPRELNATPNRIVHYGMLARGLVAAVQIKKGMTSDQVSEILPKKCNMGIFSGMGGTSYWLPEVGLGIHFRHSWEARNPCRVDSIMWTFRTYTPVQLGH